ncbi:galectin-3-binding protein A [Paralichthys olivaceus]|uniref:galectin-3-binding protein A n=1 Tax=Paralichthys olivaceus TaxID=8255 RepID=UPI00097D64CD|nr:PREDICTED: galectin-3-binding protein [Paralichthys olivaceus]
MLMLRNICTLWILLLPHVTGSAFRFNLHKRKAEPQEGDLRLFGSQSNSEGRVEVFHEGKWGTVCDDGWDMAEAQVVCRQLRFFGAKSVVIGKDYGEVTGPIWLDDINCEGTENHLFTCGFKGWGVTDCSHKEDVGIICETESTDSPTGDSRHLLDHGFSLSDDLGKIFDSENGCDFLILVKSATGNRQEEGTLETVETTICAHKIILSQFPFFNASEEISNITVDISQPCQPYFTSFIRYIYTRKIDVTLSSVQCLHWMASRFGVKQLMEGAARLFSKVLPEDPLFHTQVSIYKYAQETEDLVLQENCIQYLAWNYENLTRSPAWADLSVELIRAILARSDLVVPDEYFLLQTVESWIEEQDNSISLDTQADLLNHIRFPMIPVEKLYELESNSSLFGTHKRLYQDNMLKAFKFNVLLFSKMLSNPQFNRDDDEYQPRLYNAEPWSISISSAPGQSKSKSFNTPLHNSVIFKDSTIHWEATLFTHQYECSNRGLHCKSLPMTRLYPHSYYDQEKILFHNQLLLLCQGKYICQVQDFKDNLAHVAENSTLAYPCPHDQLTYLFVVRPEYLII